MRMLTDRSCILLSVAPALLAFLVLLLMNSPSTISAMNSQQIGYVCVYNDKKNGNMTCKVYLWLSETAVCQGLHHFFELGLSFFLSGLFSSDWWSMFYLRNDYKVA